MLTSPKVSPCFHIAFIVLRVPIWQAIRSIRTSQEKGKTTLTASGKEHIQGVQAQLFAETIRDFEWVEYYTFPKILGLVERGWNAFPAWSTLTGEKERQAFNKVTWACSTPK